MSVSFFLDLASIAIWAIQILNHVQNYLFDLFLYQRARDVVNKKNMTTNNGLINFVFEFTTMYN